LVVTDSQRSVFETLAARADIEPGSQQILVGGIGSGKTTELLLAKKWLAAKGRYKPLYIDVSSYTDLSRLTSGALLASLGIHLLDEQAASGVPKSSEIETALKTFAYGRERKEVVSVPAYSPSVMGAHSVIGAQLLAASGMRPEERREVTVTEVARRLFPPVGSLDADTAGVLPSLRKALAATMPSSAGFQAALFFDGLDRVQRPENFYTLVRQDLAALKSLDVSVIIAAPISVLGTPIETMVESVLRLPNIDPKASSLLPEILSQRGAEEAMSRRAIDLLCRYSGGVLRDLISLSRAAILKAYLANCDRIDESHVETSAREMGYAYYLGLGSEQVQTLLKLRDSGSFSPDTPDRQSLLTTGQVLQYEGPPPRYEVHPTLAPLLEAQ
jgi:hypothetical protein